jgi:RNA polymerase sigma-70 factor (ECF subfamily)
MLPVVYDELHRLAAQYLSREATGHTLQPTALVNEAYIRLVDQRRVDWRNRAQFLGLAANMMRRILVNHARDRAALKRGGNAQQVSLSLLESPSGRPDMDLIALEDVLERLAAMDERKSRVVELKFFGGLTQGYDFLPAGRPTANASRSPVSASTECIPCWPTVPISGR